MFSGIKRCRSGKQAIWQGFNITTMPVFQTIIFLFKKTLVLLYITNIVWERSGSVVECLTGDRGGVGLSLNDVTALCP